MKTSFIQLDRSITEWRWYQKPNTFRVFIHCILKANWEEKEWGDITIPRGTFVTSQGNMGDDLGLTRKQIITALDNLKRSNDITVKRGQRFSIITVCNYDTYQGVYNDKGHLRDNKGTSKGHLRDTTNKYNKENKEYNIIDIESAKEICLGDERWRSAIVKNSNVPNSKFEGLLNEFVAHAITEGTTDISHEEFRVYFKRWFQNQAKRKKKLYKQPKQYL